MNDDGDLQATIGKKIGEQLRRGSPAYKAILQSSQWQRDNYFMGSKYADQRRRERERRPLQVKLPRVGYVRSDPHALGLAQISRLGASFIPSDTVKQALMPIVLQQPRGALYQPALRGIISLIDSQQATVDALVRSNVLHLLEQERLRKVVANSTKGYIADSSHKTDDKRDHAA